MNYIYEYGILYHLSRYAMHEVVVVQYEVVRCDFCGWCMVERLSNSLDIN